jgi:Na+/glutamate symporter
MMRRAKLFLTLILFLLLVTSALAMRSNNYRLDWFTPLTSGGGGAASSANYAADLTIGQMSSVALSSANYGVCTGYWCRGGAEPYSIYLPVVVRDF